MKSIEIVLEALRITRNIVFMPITAVITARKMIQEAHESEQRFSAFGSRVFDQISFWKNVTSIVLFGMMWTTLWGVAIYFAWPYIRTGLWWLIEGVWGLHFADTTWATIYGAFGASILVLFFVIREWMRERSEEIERLQRSLGTANSCSSDWESRYCELLAGLMVVKKHALDNKEAARSKHAGAIREDLEKILNENPAYVHLLIRINPATERWERKLK